MHTAVNIVIQVTAEIHVDPCSGVASIVFSSLYPIRTDSPGGTGPVYTVLYWLTGSYRSISNNYITKTVNGMR